MRGVRASYDAVLPPKISIVWHPGRPVISGMERRLLVNPYGREIQTEFFLLGKMT